MKYKDIVSWLGLFCGGVCTALQADEVLKWVQLAITILSSAIAMSFTIWRWWKKASEDGKITKDEVDDLMEDLDQIVNKEEGDKDK